MKVALFSCKSYDREYFTRYREDILDFQFYDVELSENTVRLADGCKAVCVFVNDNLGKKVIEKLAFIGVKLIAMRCAGFNNVDLAACKEQGIRVVRVPAYSPHAVAEHALSLILTLNRKTHKAYNRIREGNFSLERLVGFDLHNKTVGCIGTGQIGAVFCSIMQGLGCKVFAYDIHPSEPLMAKGVTYVQLEELLQISDIVSLHCPLNRETYHLIDDPQFTEMKTGAMLINTSRGGLINTKAAVKALKSKKLGFLGIDVYEQEEHLFFYDYSETILEDELISRLITFPNVLITSHQAFLTDEALTAIAQTTIQSIIAFEFESELENEIVL